MRHPCTLVLVFEVQVVVSLERQHAFIIVYCGNP